MSVDRVTEYFEIASVPDACFFSLFSLFPLSHFPLINQKSGNGVGNSSLFPFPLHLFSFEGENVIFSHFFSSSPFFEKEGGRGIESLFWKIGRIRKGRLVFFLFLLLKREDEREKSKKSIIKSNFFEKNLS